MQFTPGDYLRILTVDGMRYGGPVRASDSQFLRIHDEKSNADIIIAVSTIARAEVQ